MADLAPQCDHLTGCITCGDEAIPMGVRRASTPSAAWRCATTAPATRSTVEIGLVEPVGAGERLLVHAGTAGDRDGPGIADRRGGR